MGSDIDRLLDEHDATAVAAAIRSGEVDAAEVMAVSIARAEERNPALNAFVSTRFDQAAQEAAALDRDAPFAGVPFVVKDLAAQVAGLPHTRGSRLFADDVSQSDSELVRRYRAAGLIILGTTNAPELGLNASTEPSLNGPTRNPMASITRPAARRAGPLWRWRRESCRWGTATMVAVRSAFPRPPVGCSA